MLGRRRYAFFDHQFTTRDGRPTSKLFFFFWAPSIAAPASMMAFAAHRAAVSKALSGVEDIRASSARDILVAVGAVAEEEVEGTWDPDA
jgi:hypothetical protein